MHSRENSYGISVITHFEVGLGNRPWQQKYWDTLLLGWEILPVTLECVELAIEIQKNLIRSNRKLPLPDLLIGITALQAKVPLATLNAKHFRRIPELKLLAPETLS